MRRKKISFKLVKMIAWQENGPKMFYIGLTLSTRAREWFVYQKARKGSFLNYVDKTR